MKRMPNGITGSFFYEKAAPSHTPDWMRRAPWRARTGPVGRGQALIDYLMVEDMAGLLFMANLGCIEFHPLHSRCDSYEFPDYAFFDLDPLEPPFRGPRRGGAARERGRERARPRLVREDVRRDGDAGLRADRAAVTHDEARDFVRLVGAMINKADPDRVTMEWEIRRRTGKVFIDHNMNRSGANISAVYSMRPEPGGTVSTPLRWTEVKGGLSPSNFRIDNAFSAGTRSGTCSAR